MFPPTGCGVITVVPGTDQSLSINSPVNVTFACNVSEDEPNLARRQAIWEVQNRQIQGGPVSDAFEDIGIFVEEVEMELVNLIVNSSARMEFQDTGLMVRCTAFTVNPPETQLGETLFIRTYGECLHARPPVLQLGNVVILMAQRIKRCLCFRTS